VTLSIERALANLRLQPETSNRITTHNRSTMLERAECAATIRMMKHANCATARQPAKPQKRRRPNRETARNPKAGRERPSHRGILKNDGLSPGAWLSPEERQELWPVLTGDRKASAAFAHFGTVVLIRRST